MILYELFVSANLAYCMSHGISSNVIHIKGTNIELFYAQFLWEGQFLPILADIICEQSLVMN